MVPHKDHADAWQTKVQCYFRLPFPFPWLLIGGAAFAAAYSVSVGNETGEHAVIYLALQALLIAAIANATVFTEKILDEVADAFPPLLDQEPEHTRDWLDSWYSSIFWSNRNLWVGALFAVVLLCSGIPVATKVFTSPAGIVGACVLNLVVGFLAGSQIWVMMGIARLMLALGNNVPIRPSIFETSTSPLRSASGVLWKVSLITALIYMLGLSMCFFCGIYLQIGNVLLTGFAGVFLILYYLVPQVNIHKTLKQIKGDRLAALIVQIDKTFDDVATNPNPQNIGQLRELFDLQHVVNGKQSWSFGTNELLMLISSIVIPLLLFAAGYYLRQH